MRKSIKPLLFGAALGAGTMYFAAQRHVVRTDEGVLVLPRVTQVSLKSSYVDIRDWGAGMWKQHPDVAAALVKDGRGDLVVEHAAASLSEELIDPFLKSPEDDASSALETRSTRRPISGDGGAPPPIAMPRDRGRRAAQPDEGLADQSFDDAPAWSESASQRPALARPRTREVSSTRGPAQAPANNAAEERSGEQARSDVDRATDQLDESVRDVGRQVESALESLFAPYEENLAPAEQAAPSDIGPGWRRPPRAAGVDGDSPAAGASAPSQGGVGDVDDLLPIAVGELHPPLASRLTDLKGQADQFADWDAVSERALDALRSEASIVELGSTVQVAEGSSRVHPASRTQEVQKPATSEAPEVGVDSQGDVFVDLQSLDVELGKPAVIAPPPSGPARRAAALPGGVLSPTSRAGRVIETQSF